MVEERTKRSRSLFFFTDQKTTVTFVNESCGTAWDEKKKSLGKKDRHTRRTERCRKARYLCRHGKRRSQNERMSIRDLAAIILYAFDVDAPDFDENGWTSHIPIVIFEDAAISEHRDISRLTGTEPRISRAPHTTEPV